MVYLSGMILECRKDPTWWPWVHPHYTRACTAPATPPMAIFPPPGRSRQWPNVVTPPPPTWGAGDGHEVTPPPPRGRGDCTTQW